jgi:hypothetical protein
MQQHLKMVLLTHFQSTRRSGWEEWAARQGLWEWHSAHSSTALGLPVRHCLENHGTALEDLELLLVLAVWSKTCGYAAMGKSLVPAAHEWYIQIS